METQFWVGLIIGLVGGWLIWRSWYLGYEGENKERINEWKGYYDELLEVHIEMIRSRAERGL